MGSYLCVSVTFLDATFHGRGDGGEPEWPPSPLRLFQAIVAAAAVRWRGPQFDDYAAPALKWLAGLDPPLIVASAGHPGTPYRIAVPNNDMDLVGAAWAAGREPKKGPAELKTMKTVRPTRLREGVPVRYLWPLPGPEPTEHARVLEEAMRNVFAVGLGVDLVAAAVTHVGEDGLAAFVRQDGADLWRPAGGDAPTGLRVPTAGTLAALTDRHQKFLGRLDGGGFTPVPPLAAGRDYRVVGYRRATDPIGRPFAAFELVQPLHKLADGTAGSRFRPFDLPNPLAAVNGFPDGTAGSRFRPFDTPRWAAAVAGMVRHATDLAARDAHRPEEWINTFVHGHTADGERPAAGPDADQRFLYLPLPTVNPLKVEMVRRVLVVGPAGGRAEVDWARRALSGRELFAEDRADPVAMLSAISNADKNVAWYAGKSEVWSTVTPVILPGHDDGSPKKAWRLLKTAFVQAGLAIELVDDGRTEYEWRSVGFRAGVGHVREYRVPDTLDRRPRFHVRVRFPVPVVGPLAVGAGRYRGLGVFAAG